MNSLKLVLLASVATVGLAGVAYAADPILPPVYDEPIVDVVVDNSWQGAYVGVYGGVGLFGDDFQDWWGDDLDNSWGLGVNAGYNFVLGDAFVVGVEGQVGWYTNDDADFGPDGIDGFEAYALGRLGFAVSDAVLIYGAAGVGYIEDLETVDGSGIVGAFGGGVELAVTESIGIKGEALYVTNFDDVVPFSEVRATVGLNFHF